MIRTGEFRSARGQQGPRVSEVLQHGQVGLAEVAGERGHRHQLADQVLDPHLVLAGGAGEPVTGADPPVQRRRVAPGTSSRCSPPGSASGIRARVSASIPFDFACLRKNLRRSAALAEDTRYTSWPRRAKNTAIGSHAGPVGSNTTTSRVPSGAPASAARSINVSDSTAGTHDDRHTSRPSASSTRTECREAIPRSIPTRRLPGGCLSCSTATSLPHLRTCQLRRQAGSNPSATVPGRRSPATAPTHVLQPAQAPCGLGHFPHAGHPWPGQQWQSNPRGPASHRPQNLRRRHLPDQPGMLMQPWNPCADQAPEFLT